MTVTLHEGAGFSAPDQSQESPINHEHKKGTLTHSTDSINSLLPYALLDYDKSQVSVSSILGTVENPRWLDPVATCKFDVTRATNLTIHLHLRCPGAEKGFQHVLLGVVNLNLFQGTTVLGSQWLQMQDGTGRFRISLEYTSVKKRVFEVDDSEFSRLNDSRNVLRLKKTDTQRQYTRKSIKSAELHHVSKAIHHPFIASLAFALPSPKGAQFFRPFITGGHLFNHLQRLQRFDTDRSKFYAASIVCALEYLHDTCDVVPWLKPGNVLLDALGHVTLCGFGLLKTQSDSNSQFERKMPEYPAPELLVGEENDSGAANWWTLGILLYEMLAGLPPFYDDNNELRRRNILEQPVHFPDFMEPSATDLLSKLLDHNPERRLRAGGAADIKAHAFFQGLDWQKLLSRRWEPVFIPDYVVDTFEHNDLDSSPEPPPTLQDQFYPWTYTGPIPAEPESKDGPQTHQVLESGQSTIEPDGEYELVWEDATRKFYFHNPLTKTRKLVHARVKDPIKPGTEEVLLSSTMSQSPNSAQKQAALEIALNRGYRHAISQLLEYGMDLNIQIVVNGKKTTPLQWAAGYGDVVLVRLFLTKSTKKTDRVAGTRALGLAVDRRDAAIVKEMLTNGVCCDFEESDRPSPRPSYYTGCEFYDASDPEGFLAPLVRAVKHGDIELARLLLLHGANANVGYHDLRWRLPSIFREGESVGFSCGRVVQLGMQLEHLQIVQLLLRSGADIDLEQPVWDVAEHRCHAVPRAVYQRVIHGLRRLSG